MLQKQSFDIIVAGAGLSGLTLALELARRPAFRDKRIVLLDRDSKQNNDRTWCFWATETELLPPVVYHSWNQCHFFAPDIATRLSIAPYRYQMIRGIDFYRWALGELAQYPNIRLVRTQIGEIDAAKGEVHTDAGVFEGGLVFNSAFTKIPVLPQASPVYKFPPLSSGPSTKELGRHIFLLQHFKGWLIETPDPAFDPAAMTFMDFRIDQCGETRFVYVLPFSTTQALVEFTVFSPELLSGEAYDMALAAYLNRFLGIHRYTVIETEFGVIPMTNYPFPSRKDGRVIHIGTAGGFVKASSGYAFKRTQRKIRAFIDHWEQTGTPNPDVLRSAWSFRAFDSIFLQVLHAQNDLGRAIFTNLFRHLPSNLVLRFLDEDSSVRDNLRLISAPPTLPFLRAFLRQLPNLHRI